MLCKDNLRPLSPVRERGSMDRNVSVNIVGLQATCRHRQWSVKHDAELVAVGVAVGRGSVCLRWWFNTQSGSFEIWEGP